MSSESEESVEIQSLSEIVNSADDSSSEGEEITEEGVQAIQRIAALKIKDHSEEEKKERQQKKQIMDFKVRVSHLLELYLEKSSTLIPIDKIIDALLLTHSQALSQSNLPLLIRARTMLRVALKRGRKEQPTLLVACLTKNFQKLITQYLGALRKHPKNASQIQKVILSIVANIQSSEEDKTEFFKLLKATLKTIMIHCFKGHLPQLDISTLKELVASLNSQLLAVTVKCLSGLMTSQENEGARTEYQRSKAISLLEYSISLAIKRSSDNLSKLYSHIVKSVKISLQEWDSWKHKPFKKLRPLLLCFMRLHRVLREKDVASVVRALQNQTESGMKLVRKGAKTIENEEQRTKVVKLLKV